MALIFLPVAAIGAIPADHSFGVWELLQSLPIKGNIYLVGKILGLSATVAFIGIFPLALFFAILEGILLTHFQVGIPWGLLKFYLELALLDGIPIMFFCIVVGALAGVVFRSRRAAILPGFAIGLVSLLFWKAAFKAPPVTFYQFDLAAYYVFQGYHSLNAAGWARIRSDFPAFENPLLGSNAPFVGIIQVLLMYLVILVVLAGAVYLGRSLVEMEGRFIVNSLQQILAIARTEFRFSFRRSAPVVVTVLIGLLVSAGILVAQIAMLPNWITAENMTPDSLKDGPPMDLPLRSICRSSGRPWVTAWLAPQCWLGL